MSFPSSSKKVWILEKSSNPLKREILPLIDETSKEAVEIYESSLKKNGINESVQNIQSFFPNWHPGKYVLSGPCAYFNEKNDNDRYYTKKDYLPHGKYLVPQIEEGTLFGSSDHDEDFNVSMKDVSHIIKKWWFNEETEEVWISIEIIPTLNGNGQDIIAIIEAGGTIFVSSRATGYMDDKGNVTIDTIYTYDIVYRPGFKRAKMTKVNEAKSYGDNVAIYEWLEPKVEEQINNQNKNNSDMEYVKKEDFDNFTNSMNEFMTTIKKSIANPQPILENNAGLPAGKHKFVKINEDLIDTKKEVVLTPDEVYSKLLSSDFKVFKKLTEDAGNIYDCYFLSKDEIKSDSLEPVEKISDKAYCVVLKYNKELTDKVAESGVDTLEVKSTGSTVDELKTIITSVSDESKAEILAQVTKALDGTKVKAKAIMESLKIFSSINEQEEILQGEADRKAPVTGAEMAELIQFSADQQLKINEQSEKISLLTKKYNETVDFLNEMYDYVAIIGKNLQSTQLDAAKAESEIARMNEGLESATKNISEVSSNVDAVAEKQDEIAGKQEEVAGNYNLLKDKHNETVETVNSIIDEVTSLKPERLGSFEIHSTEGMSQETIKALLNGEESIKSFDQNSNIAVIKLDGRSIDQIISQNPDTFKSGVSLSDQTPEKDLSSEAIVENAKKKGEAAKQLILESQYPFLNLLGKEEKESFVNSKDIIKKRVSEAIYESKAQTTEQINEAFVNVVTDSNTMLMLNSATAESSKMWENLNNNDKNQVANLFRRKGINNSEEAELFWESLDLTNRQAVNVNESKSTFSEEGKKKSNDVDILGYDVDEIKLN